MEELSLELFEDVVTWLADDYRIEMDSVIETAIKRAILSFKGKRNYPSTYSRVDEDLTNHYACLFDLAIFWVTKLGTEFQTFHSESGSNRTWDTEINIFVMHGICPFARCM